MIPSAADFAATLTFPSEVQTQRARIILIFRKWCDGTITGSITLLHMRTPKKFGVRCHVRSIYSGRTQYCERQWQTTQHSRENKHSDVSRLHFYDGKIPMCTKVQKIYIHHYCTGYSSRHTNPLFTSPLPIAMYIMNKLYPCYTGAFV